MLLPLSTHASTLTPSQVSAIISLLQAFGVDSATIAIVEKELQSMPKTKPKIQKTTQNTQLGSVVQAENVVNTEPLQFFTGAVQETFVNVVTNQPAKISGNNVANVKEIFNGDTTYRNTKKPANTYVVSIKDSSKPFSITVSTSAESITRTISK